MKIRFLKVNDLILFSILSLIVLVSNSNFANAQSKRWAFEQEPQDFDVHNHYNKQDGYYLFVPKQNAMQDSMGLVVFTHGYGGLNPMNYGGWLKTIIDAGNVVVYPRYQKNLYFPRTKKFADSAAEGIRSAVAQIKALGLEVNTDKALYFGHSYGGTLGAYMISEYKKYEVPVPVGGFLVAPGTNRFKGSRLTSYQGFNADAQVLILTHEGDHVTGTEFADLVFKTAPKQMNLAWIRQAKQKNAEHAISQGHNECTAIDRAFDTGYRNFTTRRAIAIGRVDVIDENLIWPLTQQFSELIQEGKLLDLFEKRSPQFDFGYWPNGQALEDLPIKYKVLESN